MSKLEWILTREMSAIPTDPEYVRGDPIPVTCCALLSMIYVYILTPKECELRSNRHGFLSFVFNKRALINMKAELRKNPEKTFKKLP